MPLLPVLAKQFDFAATTAGFAGDDVQKASTDLRTAGVEVAVKPLTPAEEGDVLWGMDRRPFLKRGDRATVYTRNEKVVAVVREDADEVAVLRREVADLRESIAALGGGRRGGPR
jgi:hypothetical protein